MGADYFEDARHALVELRAASERLRGFDDAPETLAAIQAIDAAIMNARALMNRQVDGRHGDPFYVINFGSGQPRRQESPLLPSLVAVRGRDSMLDRFVTALEQALVDVLYVADSQDNVDANMTASRYLYIAGALATIEPHVLVLANHLVR